MKIYILSLAVLSVMLLTHCNLVEVPSDAMTTASLTKTSDGLLNAANGAYALFKDHVSFNGTTDDNNMYLRQYFQLSDFESDDIVCGQVTEDPLFYSFSYNHTATQPNTRYFWYISYKIINDANTVIEAGEKEANPSAQTRQLIGECYFLRAFCHFNLVRLFAKPYTLDSASAGIILRTSTDEKAQVARATVKEVYASVIKDAEKAAGLMNQPRGVQYASKEAAWALLSRVCLYEGNNQGAADYATRVISSGRFSLSAKSDYPSMFANAASSPETIFCIAFTSLDDYGKFGSIASMIYSDGNSGWGEEYASKPLRDLLSEHSEDVRNAYIIPLTDGSGNIQLKNGIPIYYISKFSFQGGSPTLSSPIMFRLSEMYLNRAEAEAKLGKTTEAITDVDMIRKNRGLQNFLYNGTVPAGSTALDIVLKERRMELCFEGQRVFDVFRNGRDLNRTYWGYHLPGLKETDIDLSRDPANYAGMIIKYSDPKILYKIPVDEILSNPFCTQNP